MSVAAHALPRGSSFSTAIGRCARSGAAARARSGSPATSTTGSTWRSRSSPARGRRRTAPSARRRPRHGCGTSAACAHGFGSDSGHVYIAYEYVGGRTLREVMRGGAFRDGQAVEAAAQILEGLAHAHGRGIVHRDVKPSNVLLADEDAISVRLLDFGLAQFDEAETLTAVGDVPGTLAYISPERLRGEEACSASDVWAVGILLWEALAGKHPFWGVPLQQMAGTIEAGCPPLQPERPDLPKRLLAAVSHAVAHDPARRPPAAALAQELRSALAGASVRRRSKVLFQHKLSSPVSLRPPSPGQPRSPADWRCRSIRLGALAAVAAVAAFRSPRAGLALALAAPVLPLGNHALGLALLYGALALAWLVLCWRDARWGLAFLAGPALAAAGLLALLPLAVAGAEVPSAEPPTSSPSPSRASRPACGKSSSARRRCADARTRRQSAVRPQALTAIPTDPGSLAAGLGGRRCRPTPGRRAARRRGCRPARRHLAACSRAAPARPTRPLPPGSRSRCWRSSPGVRPRARGIPSP